MKDKTLKLNLQFFSEKGSDQEQNKSEEYNQNTDNAREEQSKNDEKTFTQKEVNEIIKERVAREKRKAEEQAEEAAKYARMNKEQKEQHDREKMQKELNELRAEKALREMQSEARKELEASDVVATDEIVKLVTDETADKTKQNVEALVSFVQKTVNDAINKHARQSIPANGDSFKHKNESNQKSLAEIAKQKRIIKN